MTQACTPYYIHDNVFHVRWHVSEIRREFAQTWRSQLLYQVVCSTPFQYARMDDEYDFSMLSEVCRLVANVKIVNRSFIIKSSTSGCSGGRDDDGFVVRVKNDLRFFDTGSGVSGCVAGATRRRSAMLCIWQRIRCHAATGTPYPTVPCCAATQRTDTLQIHFEDGWGNSLNPQPYALPWRRLYQYPCKICT